jgi:hypothetical protein
MKIYINHFNLLVLPDLLKNLSKYKINSEEYWQIYSTEGIYLIDQSSTMKLKPVDNDIIILKNFYEKFTLIVDPSFYIIEKVTQIPPEHIKTRVKKEYFKMDDKFITNKNLIKLVIESEKVDDSGSVFNFFNNNNYEDGYIPKDIYFELPNGSDIKDALVKEELIVFLSLLN